MPLTYAYKQWDSEFFGFQVVDILGSDDTGMLPFIMRELHLENYRLAYWKIDPEDKNSIRSAEKANAFYADKRTTLLISIKSEINGPINMQIEKYTGSINEDLISLAIQSGEYSRFKNDIMFPENTFEKIYTIWIKRSIEENYAKEIFVAKEDNKIIGFVSVGEIDVKRAEIDQIAVDKNYRRKKIGKELIQAAINWANENNYTELQVATQKRNITACKFYTACNFKIEKEELIYHIWL
ncbi:MAG: GNAT family N-acetyltransferase [Fimbriimonadaceae bacterium]|nr:GNAT family N-acetyltransferase [Chitinophagales bacterium]